MDQNTKNKKMDQNLSILKIEMDRNPYSRYGQKSKNESNSENGPNSKSESKSMIGSKSIQN